MIEKQRGIILSIVKSLDKEALLLKLIGKERMHCPKCGGVYQYNYDIWIS